MYEIISIQRTESPLGADGSVWYRYEIANGRDTIHGCKQGSLDFVTTEVEKNVEQLNERQIGKRARVEKASTRNFKPCK